jgi:peptidoglycan/LPS O-acetylase OafA/YrhL
MPNTRQPLFLARANYRRRRLRDGARMLPIFGFFLLMLPMFWVDGQRFMVLHWGYLFLAWAGLIAVAALLAAKLVDGDAPIDFDADPSEHAPDGKEIGGTDRGAQEMAPPKQGA